MIECDWLNVMQPCWSIFLPDMVRDDAYFLPRAHGFGLEIGLRGRSALIHLERNRTFVTKTMVEDAIHDGRLIRGQPRAWCLCSTCIYINAREFDYHDRHCFA